MNKVHRVNYFAWHLRRMSPDHLLYRADSILAPIAAGIRQAGIRVETAAATGHEEFADAVCDDENYAVEALLGAAFVVCQEYVTTSVVFAKDFHAFCKTTGKLPGSSSENPEVLTGRNSPLIGNSGLTMIQGIDTAANYFKHHSEWPAMWEPRTDEIARMRSKPGWRPSWLGTSEKAIKLGMGPGSTGNLRTASTALGNPNDFSNIRGLLAHIEEWLQNTRAVYIKELTQLRVVG